MTKRDRRNLFTACRVARGIRNSADACRFVRNRIATGSTFDEAVAALVITCGQARRRIARAA